MRHRDHLRKVFWISAFLSIFVLAFVTSVVFLNPSSVGNQNFIRNVNIWASVWALIFIAVLSLMVGLARHLVRLFFEFQTGRLGARIKSKLVLTFVIFSLFPAVIMAFLAFGLINQNLTTWVSAPSEQLLESSRTIADKFYSETEARRVGAAQALAQRWRRGEVEEGRLIDRFSADGVEGALILDSTGGVVRREGELPHRLLPRDLGRALEGGAIYRIERRVNLDSGIVDLGVVGVPIVDDQGAPDGSLFLAFRIPASVAYHLDRVAEANQVYEGLKGTLVSLRLTYIFVLAMTTLAVVFGFVWLGNYIAKRLSVPLEALAEGSRELAGGNLDFRVDVSAVDELGILVESFNRMASQLRESRQKLETANDELRKTNVHLDERRRYIETVLQNIATGVITVDESDRIRTANQAALKMFQVSAEQILHRSIRAVADEEIFREFLEIKKRASLYGTYRSQLTFQRNGRRLYVAATVTANRLPLADATEYLIVLDDLTELIRAEKFAAWQEVARRLAHEIKNPLTPIQLSAERIQRRFERLSPFLPDTAQANDYRRILEEATRIIGTESRMLKNLLSEFSRFARLPMCKATEVDLHDLIEATLKRFNGSLDSFTITRSFDPRIHSVRVDPEQMQRVFINLIDNSMDALVDEPDRRIGIRTCLNEKRRSVTVEFSDNGHGIAADDYEQLFLPYFSTKKKGTGLGLAIVRQIVSEHQGFIRAEPNDPRGTRVFLEIPLSA